MKREDLSGKKRAEYDRILSEMMAEIEHLPPLQPNRLSHARNLEYRQIEKKYLPLLRDLFRQ